MFIRGQKGIAAMSFVSRQSGVCAVKIDLHAMSSPGNTEHAQGLSVAWLNSKVESLVL